MRNALIDDATLEAAKRMEGKSVTQNAFETAGDILALDNLIQAILYCDQILYLDYEGRKSSFKMFDPFQRVELDEKSYQKLLFITNKMSYEYVPCIEGGRFTDEFYRALFQALGIEFRFAWEKKGGYYCLTPSIVRKANDDELLHKQLLGILLQEVRDKSFLEEIEHRIPLLYDSEGQIINNRYTVKDDSGREYPTKLSAQTDLLFKALNYMIFRSNLHLLAANKLNADMILSPIRSLIQWGGFNRFYLGNYGPVPQLADAIHKSSPGNAVRLKELPFYSLWIAEHMNGGAGFIRAAYELREEKEFRTARNYFTEILDLTESDGTDAGAVASAISRFEDRLGRIARQYRLPGGRGRLTAPFALISIVSSSRTNLSHFGDFSADSKRETPAADDEARKSFSVVFRSVLEDLICLNAMEESLDGVTSHIQYSAEGALQNIRIRPDQKEFRPHGSIVPM
jgi:hypothetical protein